MESNPAESIIHLENRISYLEDYFYGKRLSGNLNQRLIDLEKSMYGEQREGEISQRVSNLEEEMSRPMEILGSGANASEKHQDITPETLEHSTASLKDDVAGRFGIRLSAAWCARYAAGDGEPYMYKRFVQIQVKEVKRRLRLMEMVHAEYIMCGGCSQNLEAHTPEYIFKKSNRKGGTSYDGTLLSNLNYDTSDLRNRNETLICCSVSAEYASDRDSHATSMFLSRKNPGEKWTVTYMDPNYSQATMSNEEISRVDGISKSWQRNILRIKEIRNLAAYVVGSDDIDEYFPISRVQYFRGFSINEEQVGKGLCFLGFCANVAALIACSRATQEVDGEGAMNTFMHNVGNYMNKEPTGGAGKYITDMLRTGEPACPMVDVTFEHARSDSLEPELRTRAEVRERKRRREGAPTKQYVRVDCTDPDNPCAPPSRLSVGEDHYYPRTRWSREIFSEWFQRNTEHNCKTNADCQPFTKLTERWSPATVEEPPTTIIPDDRMFCCDSGRCIDREVEHTGACTDNEKPMTLEGLPSKGFFTLAAHQENMRKRRKTL